MVNGLRIGMWIFRIVSVVVILYAVLLLDSYLAVRDFHRHRKTS